MLSKCKKIGAMAVAALATLAPSAMTQASVSSPYANLYAKSSSISNLGGNGSVGHINMGSFQNNGTITTTISPSEEVISSDKATRLGMLKTHLARPKDVKLGLDALLKFDEDVQKKKFLSDVDAAFSIAAGRRSPYGSVGCAETVTYAGSYYSPALRDAFNKGIAYVPSLLADLSSKGFAIEPFNGFANKGDLLVYGDDDHVVIADGYGGCFGNSSSRMQAMYYANAANAWNYGEMPSKVVRMS